MSTPIAWNVMLGAPRDRPIIVIDRNGYPHRAQWMDQEANWRRHEVHGFVAADSVIDGVLWTEIPTHYELYVGKST